MNAIADFERTIASQHFSSYKYLNECLTTFAGTYGFRFNNAKFSYFDEGTTHRELFVYKYLDLKCVYAKKRGCTACCNIRCRRNFLYIRAWSMEHNHPPDPPDTSTLADCTEAFKQTFSKAMLFDSLRDFEAKIRELEQITGTKFTKYSSRMLPDTSEYRDRLVYERVNYGCIHSGKTKQRGSCEQIGVRSQKIGCQARIRACIAKDKLKVMLYSMKHNHMVSSGRGTGLLRGSSKRSIQFSDGSTMALDDDSVNGERNLRSGVLGIGRGNGEEEDAEVDFELDLPNLAATAANGFRDDDLPAMPIVLKKTRSSTLGKTTGTRRSRRRVRGYTRPNVMNDYVYDEFADSHSLDVYDNRMPLPAERPPSPDFYVDNVGCKRVTETLSLVQYKTVEEFGGDDNDNQYGAASVRRVKSENEFHSKTRGGEDETGDVEGFD